VLVKGGHWLLSLMQAITLPTMTPIKKDAAMIITASINQFMTIVFLDQVIFKVSHQLQTHGT
jgi:hypothetical protein